MAIFSSSANSLLGLDISSSAIKLIELSKSGGRYRVESYAVEPLEPGAVVESSIVDTESVGAAIKRVVERSKTRCKSAAVAVSGATVITKLIQMPTDLSDAELESQISLEADQYIPYPLDEVALDFRVMGPNANNPSQVDVLLAGCRREHVDAREEALEIGGLKPVFIDVEAYAIERSFELLASQLDPQVAEGVIGIADVGATSTMVATLELGAITFTREQMFGGRVLTEEIQRRYALSPDEAGLAKKQGGLPDDYQDAILNPFCESITQQIGRSLQFFFAGSTHSTLDALVLAGGCSAIEGLDRLVSERLQVPVITCDPFADMSTAKRVNVAGLSKDAPALLIAAGLALRAFESDGINLRAWRDEARATQQRSFIAASVGALALAGATVFAGSQFLNAEIQAQNTRNNYLKQEITRVDAQIAEIRQLRELRGQLIDRMQVIQDLQGRRSEIVYVFDGVVSTLTDGTVYTSLSRRENQITLTGQAENNNRISSLMRSIDGADWFTAPNLTKVIAEKSGELPNRFDLSIALTNPVSEAQQ